MLCNHVTIFFYILNGCVGIQGLVNLLPICRVRVIPWQQRLFSWCSLTGEKKLLPWIENGFDLTAVHCLGRLYLKRMPLELFADRNLSPLRLAHFFTLLPLPFVELSL